jgi:RHS repeat-associated protein
LSGLLGSTFVSQTGFEGYSTTQTSSTLLGALTAAAFGTDTDNTRPYAYLNYVILDNALGYRNGDAERVPETAGSEPAELYLAANKPVKFGFGEEIVVEEDGYIYIWVSNESQSTRVWFDDLTITHEQNLVVQASDYGAWGDLLREQRSDDKKYRFGYQGQFAEKDEETGWNHFELREYDEIIGRFLICDPKKVGWSPYLGLGNNPINNADVDGGAPDNIILCGTNNSSMTIIAEGPDQFITVNFDFGGNETYQFNDPSLDAVPFANYIRDAVEMYPEITFDKFVSTLDFSAAMWARGIPNGSWYPDYLTAATEGTSGGKLDFISYLLDIAITNGVPISFFDRSGNGAPYFSYCNKIYNLADAGNALTGNALARLGISLEDALWGANVHNLIFEPGFEDDAKADQQAITDGWNVGPEDWR